MLPVELVCGCYLEQTVVVGLQLSPEALLWCCLRMACQVHGHRERGTSDATGTAEPRRLQRGGKMY